MRAVVEHGTVAEGQAGSQFTDGFEILQLKGDQPATILSVESVGGNGAFRQLGAMLAGPERHLAAVTFTETYPPSRPQFGKLVPAEGAVILPADQTDRRKGYELLVGYEIVEDTRVGYRAGLAVTYEVDGQTYVWHSPARLLYCPDPNSTRKCEATAEADNWGE